METSICYQSGWQWHYICFVT